LKFYAWFCARLIRCVRDQRGPTLHPTLATVTPGGKPQVRTAVLRAVDKLIGNMDIRTDLHSAMVMALRDTPSAVLQVCEAAALLQLRLEAGFTMLTGPDVTAILAGVPEPSRLFYDSTPAES